MLLNLLSPFCYLLFLSRFSLFSLSHITSRRYDGEEVTAPNHLACAKLCMFRTGCKAFDYPTRHNDRSCRLGRFNEGLRSDPGGSKRSVCTMICDEVCQKKRTMVIAESLKPSDASAKITKTALAMQSKTTMPFLIVMQASIGMVPMIKSWLCNTASMKHVHENTLIIVDEKGYKVMKNVQTKATIVMDALPKILQGSWPYGSRGYWRTTQNRVVVIGDLLRAGVTILLVEPDATWIRNVYEQDDLMRDMSDDLVGMSDDAGGIGFGFLRLKSNKIVQEVWEFVQTSVDSVMGSKIQDVKKTENPTLKMSPTGEQVFFNQEWRRRKKDGTLKARTLSTYRYPNGKWYDGGRGGNGNAYRAKCRKESPNGLVVIQNNWMVGNNRKEMRAKRWEHWFLNDDGETCKLSGDEQLQKAVRSTESGTPPNGSPQPGERE